MAAPSPAPSIHRPIASKRHFVIMLLIQVALVAIGFWLQNRSGSNSVLPQDRNVVPLYLSVMALEWGLVATVRGAVNAQGLKLADIIGGSWSHWRDVARDVAISVPFLLVWFGAARLQKRNAYRDITRYVPPVAPEIGRAHV